VKKKFPIIAISGVMIIGICVFLYPVVSALLAKMTQSSVIKQYQSVVNDLSDNKLKQMKAGADNYNKKLYRGVVLSDPFDLNADHDTDFTDLFSINDILGYIEISDINVYLPIYYSTSEEVLKKGVGLLENTSLPVGGINTHAVISGHRGLPSATLFTDLDQMAESDVFYIHVLDEILAYQVDQIKVVEPEDTSDLAIEKGKDYVTLLTCTPYGVNSQRLLIRGTRMDASLSQKAVEIMRGLADEVVIIPTLLFILLAFPIVLLIRRKR
jgi:sortase A